LELEEEKKLLPKKDWIAQKKQEEKEAMQKKYDAVGKERE